MKILFTIFLFILITCDLYAATTTTDLDPTLKNIFEQMQIDAEASKLEGKEFEANLTVKVATERFLIFSDAYLQADEETKYQIGKWMFTPDQVAELKAKRGDVLTVKFRIEAIRTQTPYDDMPHFAATIISIAPFKKAGSQEGGVLSESPHSSMSPLKLLVTPLSETVLTYVAFKLHFQYGCRTADIERVCNSSR